VTEWKKGDRVGVDGMEDIVLCARRAGAEIRDVRAGTDYGSDAGWGYAQYMIARHEAVALLPEGINWRRRAAAVRGDYDIQCAEE